MHWFDVASGILFILFIIDFGALAALVLVQEKRQACVDVVHIPKDAITELGKRGDEELEKLLEEYFNNMGNQVESSDPHASSSSAPPRPNHGSTNVVQAPAPNPPSSTANQDRLIEPSGPSSTTPMQGDDGLDEQLHTLMTKFGSVHELTGAHTPQPNPNKRPLRDPDPNFDWDWGRAQSTKSPTPLRDPDPNFQRPHAAYLT